MTPNLSFHPAETYEQALDRAAEQLGIEPEYSDTWGRVHVTPPEIQKAILAAAGVPAETKEQLNQALEEHHWEEWNRIVPPVLVLGETAPWEFPLHVPASAGRHKLSVEIRLENGEAEFREIALSDLKDSAKAQVRGQGFRRKAVPLPRDLPLGYHDVAVSLRLPGGETKRGAMRLIVCPDRAYVPPAVRDGGRTAGVAIALYGLRSSRNWGCGDLTDLEALIDWLVDDLGVSFVGLNPLHDTPNRYPYNISPYLPTSTFYKNPIYLDLERIEDFRNSRRACALFARHEVQQALHALRSAEYVDYGSVYGWKLRALKLAFLEFLKEYRAGSRRALVFRNYVEREGGLLERYATYCALNEWIHARNPDVWVWSDWPPEYRDPDSEAARAFAEKHWRLVLFYQYVQWQLQEQLARAQRHALDKGMSIGLFHDLALATDRCGADLWAYRDSYVAGCRVGAPPDSFAPKGQDWSFPPPNSARHRQTGYRLFAESIRKNCRSGGTLRIDHVMRFFRLYWIPEGMDPAHGAYVRDAWPDLLHILALESVREKVAIVGEDLGTVTPKIREALDRFGIYGYKVLYIEKSNPQEFRLPHHYPAESLVSSSTHDLPTLAGFWLAKDVEARRSAGQLDERSYHEQLADRATEKQKLLDLLFHLRLLPEGFPRSANHITELTGELHDALVGFLASTPCRLMALNQEDLLKDTEQQNLPASILEYPNWQHKMRFTIEQLHTNRQARDFAAMFRNWLERTGRLNRRLVCPVAD